MLTQVSFRGKLVLIGFALQALALGLQTFSTHQLIDRHLASEVESRARQLVPLFNAALTAPLAQRDYATVAAILAETHETRQLVYLLVNDTAGNLIAGEGAVPEPVSSPGKQADTRQYAVAITSDSFNFSAPLTLGGQRLGTVKFGLSRTEFISTRNQILYNLIVIGLAVLGTFTILVGLLSFALTRPLAALAEASRDVRAGNYDISLPPARADEIGTLIEAFGKMTAEIRRKISELTQSEALQRKYLQDSLARGLDVEQALRVAETANKAKSDFLANMSHEIRTPMNSIQGFTELLQEGELTSRQREYVNNVHSASQSLLRVINDILDFSKIEAGHLEIVPERFEPARLIAEVVELLSIPLRNKAVALHVNIDPDTPQSLVGDATRLRQVLVNLVGNAIKFTDEGKVELTLACVVRSATRSTLRFSVSDTGIGMSKAQLKGIFEPFAQADDSITRRFGGTGLGLSISRRLVALMGGDITVDSVLGKGSVFSVLVTLEVPTSAAAAEPIGATPQDPRIEAVRGMRALLVDDHDTNRLVAQALLRRLGVEVTAASNAQQALAAVAHAQFDIVLMDLQMPDVDGFETTRQILALLGHQAPPIIAVSASALQQDQAASLAAGMSDHLAKPIDRARLLTTLTRWVKPRPTAPPASAVDTAAEELAVDQGKLDSLLSELAEMLAGKLMAARRPVEAIEQVLGKGHSAIAFRPVAEATRKLRFDDAQSALRIFIQARQMAGHPPAPVATQAHSS